MHKLDKQSFRLQTIEQFSTKISLFASFWVERALNGISRHLGNSFGYPDGQERIKTPICCERADDGQNRRQ